MLRRAVSLLLAIAVLFGTSGHVAVMAITLDDAPLAAHASHGPATHQQDTAMPDAGMAVTKAETPMDCCGSAGGGLAVAHSCAVIAVFAANLGAAMPRDSHGISFTLHDETRAGRLSPVPVHPPKA